MKKFLIISGYSILGLILLAYLSFLFILPNVVKVDEYKPLVQQIAREQAKLDINFENAKIITTPFLGVGLKAQNISVKLPDGSVLFSADGVKTRVALPSLFLLTIKVSCFEVEKPFLNLEIENDENFKIVKLVQELVNSAMEKEFVKEQQQVEDDSFKFDPSIIKIKVPNAKLNNYKVLVNDLKSKHYLNLAGEELTLGYFNGKRLKIKTQADLFSDENKNITAKLDVNTFLPQMGAQLDKEDDPAERIDIPFVNPVTMYRNYDLKANLDTKLKINSRGSKVTSFGYFNLEDVNLKVGHLILPKSYFRAKTFGSNVQIDTNIKVKEEQEIALLGKLKYGKRAKMDMYIKTTKIYFNDLLALSRAFLDSLSIRNKLNEVTLNGYFEADTYIKTNFKRLKSNGVVAIKDGALNMKGLGRILSDVHINLLFDDNALRIVKSGLLVDKSPISIDGIIDKKSMTDIKINAKEIKLPLLFNAFSPREIKKAYNLASGVAKFDFALNGKLKNLVASANFGVEDLKLSDKANSFIVTNNALKGDLSANSKDLVLNLDNENFAVSLPKTKSKILAPKFALKVAQNDAIIEQNDILFNDKTQLKYQGFVENYPKAKAIGIKLWGDVNTSDLVKFIGNEFAPFIHYAGQIPVKVTFEGDNKKQTLFAQALSDENNFITPIDFETLLGKKTSLQSVIDFKPKRIKIKDTGIFEQVVNVDKKGRETISLREIVGVDGTIVANAINLLKITLPKSLNAKIYAFPQSKMAIDGRAFVLGQTSAPRMRGGFSVRDLEIPELLLSLKKADLKFRGDKANLDVKELNLNGSDIQTQVEVSLAPSSVLNVLNLDMQSKLIDVDKLFKVVDKAMAYAPKTTVTSTPAPADIPLALQGGEIEIDRLKTGNINVYDINSDIALNNNIFYLNDLEADVFKGSVNGDISMNLINSLLNISMRGENIDVDKALVDAANMKGTLSGKAKFDAKISLKGATYQEQMESLKGVVNFDVKDGQFGPFGKIENLIIAENIRESEFFQTALGGVIDSLTKIDTTHFERLAGEITFKDGVCHIEPITSLGEVLSLYIFGDFDLLKNHADMKIRAKMTSIISDLLGPIAAINPINLLNSAAGLNVVTAKAFSIFCETLDEEQMASIPSFKNSYTDMASMKFQLVARGDVAKPLTLIKSFKWLATAADFSRATEFVNSIPDPIEGSTATTVEEVILEAQALEAEKKTLKYKLLHVFDKKEPKAEVQEELKEAI